MKTIKKLNIKNKHTSKNNIKQHKTTTKNIKNIKKHKKTSKNKKKHKLNININNSISFNYKNHLELIKKNLKLNKYKWYFKSHKYYTEVLENIGTYYGELYIKEIIHKFKNLFITHKKLLIKLCNKNDIYGSPRKKEFKNFITTSPTNLRYILFSLLILTFINNNKLNNLDIIEIGGGYGGLAFFLYNLAPIFKIKLNSYTIFDLPDVSKLQKQYLKALNLKKNMYYYQLNNFKNLKTNSFLISTYAFTELPLSIRTEYKNKIFKYISYGYIVWNFIPIYNFIDNKDISYELEYPKTHNNYESNNFFVNFIPK